MSTDRRDENTFHKPVTFKDTVTFEAAVSQTGNQAVTGDVTASGTVQGADLAATDDLTVGDDATITGDLTVNGAVNFTGADSISLPTGYQIVRTWTSGTIVHGDLTGGAAQDTVALPAGSDGAFPAGVIVLGGYFETLDTATSSDGGTTGLTVSLGVGSSDFLATGANILGAAGKKENATGSLMGGYRAADAPDVILTATGGAADIAHINALALRVVIKYLPIT